MPVALITGAALRIGRQIACTLAAHKWDIAVHYHQSQASAQELVAELQAMGVQAQAFCADLSAEPACRGLIPQVVETLGSVSALVNNASQFLDDQASTFTYAMLDMHMRANTAPAIVLAQVLHAHIKAQQEAQRSNVQGVVVNLLDQKLWNLNPDHFSYTLSKAALHTATDLMARSFAPYIRVVGIAPGLTLPSAHMTPEQFEELHQLSPLGQSSTLQDIAQAVHFAVSNRALTGTSLLVDGGQHLMNFSRDFSKLI